MNQSILEVAVGIEFTADTLSKRGDSPFVLASALLAGVLRTADVEDVEALTDGDVDQFGTFVDRNELGNFVFEHTLETFDQLAHLEMQDREMGAKSAWDVEMELRELQGEMA
jgi:hypothetical protein